MPEDLPTTPLRRGWTTGCCATAAAAAAFEALLAGVAPRTVTVRLPRGGEANLAVAWSRCAGGEATAAVVKDAGDDPDVTHGAEIVVTVAPGRAGRGITFRAGEGVGTVTRPGLPVAVGEPAINPTPRAMIGEALTALAALHGVAADLVVTVAVPGGEALAERTLNGRLGIVGGLSILGTTGVVVPYSCASWIHSIHRGIDVARAAGLEHVAAATGRTSEAAVQALFSLPDPALIDMGDFAGGTLKYLKNHPLPRLTVAGGFAKLTKLAQGRLMLHSSRSQVDFGRLAKTAAGLGGSAAVVDEIRAADSAAQALARADAAGLPLAVAIAGQARTTAAAVVGDAVAVEVVIVDRAGGILARTDG